MSFQSSQSPGTKGLFQGNSWYCDCDPRLPAVYLQVKKKNGNCGRWFYTCQKGPGRKSGRCPFFLWADEAQTREKTHLLSGPNTPAKPVGRPTTTATPLPPTAISPSPSPAHQPPTRRQTIFKGIPVPTNEDERASSDDDLFVANEPPATDHLFPPAQAPPGRSSWSQGTSATLASGNDTNNKRKRAAVPEAEEEDYSFDEVDSETERALVAAANASQSQTRRSASSQRSGSSLSSSLSSSQGAAPRAPSTPTARRVAGPGGATPVSRNRLLTVAEGREAKRVRFSRDGGAGDGGGVQAEHIKEEDDDDEADLQALFTSTPSKPRATPPSPASRPPPASSTTRPPPASTDDRDLAATILALLPPGVAPSIRAAIRRELGRYAVRVAAEATARAAELQARVATLEEERAVERQRTRKLRAVLAEELERNPAD